MTFPNAPNLFDSQPYALHWSYSRSFGTDVCAINSAAWLRQARASVGLSSVPTWDAAFSNALISLARQLQAEHPSEDWSSIIGQLSMDAAKNFPSATGFKLATWNAFYRRNGLRLDALSIPSNIVLGYTTVADPPSSSRTSDPQMGDHVVCFRVGQEQAPEAIATSATRRQAESASSMGLRARPGESFEQDPGVLDVGQEGISLRTAAIATGLILVAGGIFWATTRMEAPAAKRKKARANPSKKRSGRKAWT